MTRPPIAGGAPPLRLADFTPYQLSVSSNAVSQIIANSYETLFGLRIPEWRLMALLGERGRVTQRELCGLSEMDKVTVSRATQHLVTRGLVERLPSDGDRRSHGLALSQAGRKLYADIVPAALGIEREVLAVLDADEIATLKALLSRLRERVHAMRASAAQVSPPVRPRS